MKFVDDATAEAMPKTVLHTSTINANSLIGEAVA